MSLTVAEKIKIVLKRKNMTIEDLAIKTKQSRQNLTSKLNRGNFSEREAAELAKALDCRFETIFTLKNGDKI